MTDLRNARLILLLLEENSSSIGHEGHVGVVQLDGLGVGFQRLRKVLKEDIESRLTSEPMEDGAHI